LTARSGGRLAPKIRPNKKPPLAGKKTPTVNNNLIVEVEERLVRSLSGTYAGSVHDKRLCDEEAYTFPPGCVLLKETGFQGDEPDHSAT
jgi:hypothetical protein